LEEQDDDNDDHYPDDRKMQQYGNLFYLLQSEPRYMATLCRLVTLAEIDTLLQTVMFTLYGNQYESREEHLLLTMFQVNVKQEPPAAWCVVFNCQITNACYHDLECTVLAIRNNH
jgi:hypothetical protein